MIEVKDISKRFGSNLAVDGVSFNVEKGQVLGFLGPNGAGKSTTMRMVTGYLNPSRGGVSVCGFDVASNPFEAKSKIGYLPENAPLYDEMTVESFLFFVADIRGYKGKEKSKRVDRVIDLCQLKPVKKQLIDTISKGYRHRTCLAQSLIHDPEVLILDEPTDGLDPNQKHGVRSLIKEMGKDKAIIFSTHILEEVEYSCSRAIIIDRGKVVADGSPEDLKSRAEDAGMILLSVSGVKSKSFLEGLEKLEEVGEVKVVESGDDFLKCEVNAKNSKFAKSLGATLSKFTFKNKGVIEELSVNSGRLDLLFRSLTKSDL